VRLKVTWLCIPDSSARAFNLLTFALIPEGEEEGFEMTPIYCDIFFMDWFVWLQKTAAESVV